MDNKVKVVIGSLVGAVSIHTALLACGSGSGGGGGMGGDGGLIDAMMGVLSDIVVRERDAVASNDDGGDAGAVASPDGGSCACGAGPTLSLPASENSGQLRKGIASLPIGTPSAIVVSGPFVLTDATCDYDEAILVVQPSGATCPALSTVDLPTVPGYLMTLGGGQTWEIGVHGGRYVIAPGEMVCAYQAASDEAAVQWAGFKPYL